MGKLSRPAPKVRNPRRPLDLGCAEDDRYGSAPPSCHEPGFLNCTTQSARWKEQLTARSRADRGDTSPRRGGDGRRRLTRLARSPTHQLTWRAQDNQLE